MKTQHNEHIQERIIAHFYMDDTLTKAEMDEIKASESHTAYFTQIKAMAETDIVNQPDDHYWENYFDRLEERYDAERQTNMVNFFEKFTPQLIAAAAVLILGFGYILGKYVNEPVDPAKAITNMDALEIETLVTRSKVLFTQFNQLDEFNARFFLEEQVNQSKDLLRLATYLRQKHQSNQMLYRFIGELEKTLISMQSIEDEDIYLVKSIQENLFQGQVLAKLEIINTKEVQ